jgi:hypothetical protein
MRGSSGPSNTKGATSRAAASVAPTVEAAVDEEAKKLLQNWTMERRLREQMLLQRRLPHRLRHDVQSGILIVELKFYCQVEVLSK